MSSQISDTICALATPPGVSGLAVIRISGKRAIEIADLCFQGNIKLSEALTQTIHYGNLLSAGQIIDTVTVALFRSPRSYTGEDVIEISSHGGNIISSLILKELLNLGCRLAEAGEFTKRAFLNGKLDLMQVEAVADVIHSESAIGALTAARHLASSFSSQLTEMRKKLIDIASLLELELDFADEDVEFLSKDEISSIIINARNYCVSLSDSAHSADILRSGYFVSIAGFPNSGKSTLFNKLLQKKRAITSDIPGTTRDYLEETLFVDQIPIKLIDTAGLRQTSDAIEIEGIKLAEDVLNQSDLILVINDSSISFDHSDKLINELKHRFPNSEAILLNNKIDLLNDHNSTNDDGSRLFISAKKEIGINELKQLLSDKAQKSTERTKDILINRRHAILLNKTAEALENAAMAIKAGTQNEAVALDIRDASNYIGELTGEIWNDDILNNIFSKFCIGK